MIRFIDRLEAPDRRYAFELPHSWVWCGSATEGPDGRYHLFVARWPRELPFFDGYKVASEIIRAEADRPEGPWRFAGVVLPDRGEGFWDGRMTHNPTVIRHRDRWFLFYIGARYSGTRPTALMLLNHEVDDLVNGCYATIRIGCAWADDPAGPWHRPDAPCLDIRPDAWDSTVITNPAPCVTPDGTMLLYYRSNTPAGCKIGVATAEHPLARFERLRDDPILEAESDRGIEDPFVWHDGVRYQMIAKDLTGKISGAFGNGVHATSADGVSWVLSDPALAWSRTITWVDGTTETVGCLERPQLLIGNDGEPTHLLCAMADGPGGFRNATRSWNQVIRLRYNARGNPLV
jgi:hypothetical protein